MARVTVEDCLEKIEYFLGAENERQDIARAGQAHTLSHYTYRQHVEQILDFIANCVK